MPNAPLAIRQKTEAAIKAYLEANIAGTALEGVDLRLRQEVTDKVFPRTVLEAIRAPADEAAGNLYRIEFHVYHGTSAHETLDAGQAAALAGERHAARVGLLSELLGEGKKDAILAFCNAPASGPDTRTVKGIRLYDIYLDDEAGEQIEQHWLDLLTYVVVAQLEDEP